MDDTKKWSEAVFNEECQLSSFLLRFPRPELFSESPVGTLKEFKNRDKAFQAKLINVTVMKTPPQRDENSILKINFITLKNCKFLAGFGIMDADLLGTKYPLMGG